MNDAIDFLNGFCAEDARPDVRHRARCCLADTLGVGFGGASTLLSGIIRDYAAEIHSGLLPQAFDGRGVNAPGYALSLGMTIDALDGHDGHNPAKGHVGAGLIPGLLALGAHHHVTGPAFETALISGYEIGSRLAVALHGSVPDYHTSGAWVAVAVAAAGGQMIGLPRDQLAHAMGIAEYHGPRSQMMRCIDHPTMVKDGSGWGSMAGVSAVLLARKGFTGAPALTISEAAGNWDGLGHIWLINEQYFKPYPVCRWAQAPVEAVLDLRSKHQITADDVAAIDIASFHEATRLAITDPTTTEEAQYSTAYPAAVAMVRGSVQPGDLEGPTLRDPEIRRIAASTRMHEDKEANARFPAERIARVKITTLDGRVFTSGWMSPRWDATTPPTDNELMEKFENLVEPKLGAKSAAALAERWFKQPIEDPAGIVATMGRVAL